MGLTRTIAPTVEPATRAELKNYARIELEDTDDDAFIDDTIAAARTYCEQYTQRAFINQTWALTLDAFAPVILCPRPPLSSVTSIQYVDTAGTTQTEAASVYTALTDRTPGEIVEADGQTWSSTQGVPNAVTVTYVAGYGAAATAVPLDIKQAVLSLALEWYDQRAATLPGQLREVPIGLHRILQQYRAKGWAASDGR